jgi:hypothetical protein
VSVYAEKHASNNFVVTVINWISKFVDGVAFPVGRWAKLLFCSLLAIGLVGLQGCYDADALLKARRDIAKKTRLVEVDLGDFRITLPSPYTERKRAEIHFRAFGQVANRDLKLVRATLAKNGPDLQNRMLLVVRKMKMREIQEPQLTTLRESLASAINDTLPGEPLQSVGFYSFGFINL